MFKMAKKVINTLPGEPSITFRAKDDLFTSVVTHYKDLLLARGYEEGDDMITSLDEIIDEADNWRELNSDKCQLPTF